MLAVPSLKYSPDRPLVIAADVFQAMPFLYQEYARELSKEGIVRIEEVPR